MGDRAVGLSVVIPTYNEESRIRSTLERLVEFLDAQPWDWEIRVVDDGSADATARIVAESAASEARIRLQREPHRGKGGAVRAGVLATDKPFRFICDADLSMPLGELPRFLPPVLEDADLAIGSREGRGARRVGEPIVRHLAGRAFNYLVQQLTVAGIEDTQCGFKMFRARAAQSIFPLVRVDGWAFDVEVLYIARHQHLRIVEVPIEWHYRRESKLSMMRDGAAMLAELLRIRARAARGEYAPPGR
jgi:glycosyltransferase involved in cell wall biosynthesis